MQVVVLVLLVAGLALLVLGLITGGTVLVVASILASLLAAMTILRYRRRPQAGGAAGSSGPAGTEEPQARTAAQVGTAAQVPRAGRAPASVSAAPLPVAVPPAHAAEEPSRAPEPAHAATEPAHAATEPARAEPLHPEPLHAELEDLAEPHDGPESTADTGNRTEPQPEDMDVAEPAEADTDPPLRSRGDEPVWVIDGRPRYHLPDCAFLSGRGPVPVPLRQAVEDGFTPCALCDPDSGLAAR
ncbi:hypothetical protein [Jatrophihabitans sp.]|uniref:hypothetical protein n=1 Tax=Jatrophihabitans sp. TaxID=1932789 RepID=UPI002EE4CC1A